MDHNLFIKRKLEFQQKQVRKLSKKKNSRYFEQLEILKDLDNDFYLNNSKFEVSESNWKNKYHNFLSNVAKSPFYEDELKALDDL